MTLEHEGQAARAPSETGGSPPDSGNRGRVKQESPCTGPANESRLEAAQRKAAAAKEAAARIRAGARQYRIEPPPPPPTRRPPPSSAERHERTAPAPRPRPAPAVDVVHDPRPAPAVEVAHDPRPAPDVEVAHDPRPNASDEIVPANGVAVAVPPPPRLRPRFPPKAEPRATPEAAPPAATDTTPPSGTKQAPFKPMRRPGAAAPAFRTAYGFRSALGTRSAGRLLIGEAQPIRPSRIRRSEEPTAEEAPRSDEPTRPDRVPDERRDHATAGVQASRFNRLSQDLAERQTWLGVDPETLKNGGTSQELPPPSRWSRLTSWLFGGDRQTTD